ncbi:MAG TPA: hypothetical protein VJ844_00255, partial [Mucilaginibacter sp.]|nr:hypothetical protein [Mucilaginibacter sp.]
EADMVYEHNGWQARLLGTIVSIPHAAAINRAYANNTPKTEYGAYAEIGYDLLYRDGSKREKQLILFVRDEKFNMNAQIPSNGVIDGTLNQNHIVTGFTYLPVKNIAIKADVRFVHTGSQNPALIINPNPAAQAYQPNYNLVDLGIALSF